MLSSLPVVNLDEASTSASSAAAVTASAARTAGPASTPRKNSASRKNLKKFLPELRPEARALIEADAS